jgi:transglutaminase-like putative cysteine protease
MFREDLFCVWPFAAAGTAPDRRLRFDRQTGRLSRKAEYTGEEFEFELATTAFEGGVQSPYYPNDEPLSDRDLADLLQMPDGAGGGGLPRLVELATRWAADLPFPAEDRGNRARFLAARLRDSGQFGYSLERQGRAAELDPIEDFVSNNPRGHCEYFATALVLMLRSQGIPARMVIGYRTGEWNDSRGLFQVRQLHAHTWVEAYLRPRDLAPRLAKDPQWASGAWLRLDPTPASGEPGGAGLWGRGLDGVLDRLDLLWSHYVLDMDRLRQHEAIYAPAIQALQQWASTLSDAGWWKERFTKLRGALGLGRGEEGETVSLLRLAEVWVLAALLFLVIGYGVYRFLRVPAFEVLSARPWRAGRRAGVQVAFYRRFEAVLARRGLVRPASRTQREFAVWAGQELAQRAGNPRLAPLSVQVAEAFYRVRFGRRALDKQQTQAIEETLSQLERAARGNRP